MKKSRLPIFLKKFFWDYEFHRLSWEKDRNLIISRLLSSGDWKSVTWLRSQIDQNELRQWITDHRGAGLNPQKLRFWELILSISHYQINSWLNDRERMIWAKRVSP
jgi:hypothetical protein